MGSRYAETRVQSYCFNPITIVIKGEKYVVPCGRCNGCLLHRANSWSQRLSKEIETSKHPLFFTLTYRNCYLPTLRYTRKYIDNGVAYLCDYHSNHSDNKYFDGKQDKLRTMEDFKFDGVYQRIGSDGRLLDGSYLSPQCMPFGYIGYLSKRDIQLFLKRLRKNIYYEFRERKPEVAQGSVRYFIIGEYGPTTYRPHYHGIIDTESDEVSDYLLSCGLFAAWQMCDKDMFGQHVYACDSRTSSYLTQYLTCISDSRPLYTSPEIKPFRLSSKSAACGYEKVDFEEICDNVSVGVITTYRDIPRLNKRSVFCYSPSLMRTYFPKCYEFSKYDFDGLLHLYGYLYREVVDRGKRLDGVCRRLRAYWHPANFTSTLKCYKICLEYGMSPYHYVFLLDCYYHAVAMSGLQSFYAYQSQAIGNPLDCLVCYDNLFDWFNRTRDTRWLQSFGIDYLSQDQLKEIMSRPKPDFDKYVSEVNEIVSNSVKLPKFYEKSGISPANSF